MVQRLSFRSRRPPVGAGPGELALQGGSPPRSIHVIDYTPDRIEEADVADVEALAQYRNGPNVTWIEVNGIGDEPGFRRIGEIFGIHPLALADVVNVPQRPKAETYDGHELVIAWMARLGATDECRIEQVSFVIGPHWVISFEEEEEDVFDPV